LSSATRMAVLVVVRKDCHGGLQPAAASAVRTKSSGRRRDVSASPGVGSFQATAFLVLLHFPGIERILSGAFTPVPKSNQEPI